MAHYTIWLSSPSGVRLAVLDQFIKLEYRRIVNHTGVAETAGAGSALPLRLTLRADALPLRFIQRDSRLEIWRTCDASSPALSQESAATPAVRTQELDTETAWFVRRVRKLFTGDGQRLLQLEAVPAIELLARRIVAYAAGTAQAGKSGPADDLMKQIVRENLGTQVGDSARDISDWLEILPDLGQAPVVSKIFARRNVLHVLGELAQAALEAGTPLYFDIVCPTMERLEFRTYPGARGSDRTFPDGVSPLVLSPETGTLARVERSFDYEDEVTFVYAAGQGAESERLILETGDAARIAASPFGRRERLVDARHVASSADLDAEARAALAAGRPRDTFRATVVSKPGAAYGQHWRWGDRVTASFDGEIIACHIDEVHVTVEHGRETVQASLRANGSEPAALSTQIGRLAAAETETTYQQVQRGALPSGSTLLVPPQGQLLVYGRYEMAGRLVLGDGAKLVLVI